MNNNFDQSDTHSFDPLIGTWSIVNRRKKREYVFLPEKEAEWDEFPARSRFEKQLAGRAVAEYWEGTLPSGEKLLGYSVKAFEPTTQQWAITWIDNRNPLDFRPVLGTFEAGAGTFFQIIETPDGQPLHLRLIWDELTESTVRWQQAFSFDEGKSWDTNWVMQFTREQ
ncbi:DUF1579 domain-containing protein [Tengunoibacter tsumagoiensis]|uniref:DUF1579 domain-containing protein n=1 Tax=Tengunoibacter tsumagoiensis TaxID=2014871 RepID=A0A402A8E4_9CHLR|nr:DUF1579 domain-containing protein [Tengunoibacter tsumagoiensis]GCE15422.1 hypothetical protein KTT_52810 [Tengunoibacter tsumagoiensis]